MFIRIEHRRLNHELTTSLAQINLKYSHETSIINSTYSRPEGVTALAYDSKRSWDRHELIQRTLDQVILLMKSLPWEDQILFCAYSNYDKILLRHLDDDQKIAVKFLK